MSITTRRADLSDAGLLHDLAARTFGLACPPGTLRSDIDAFIAKHLSAESFRGYLSDPGRIILIASEGDLPLGYSMLVSGPIADPDVARVVDTGRRRSSSPSDSSPSDSSPSGTSIELSKFYLAPDRHGSGVAATLMAATLAEAAATGASFCWLGVNQQNDRAGKFYAKQGFQVVGVKRFLVGDVWHDDHVRMRALTPA